MAMIVTMQQSQTYPPIAQPSPAAKASAQPSGRGKLWAALGLGTVVFVLYIGIQLAGVLVVFGTQAELNPVMAVCELFGGAFCLLFIVALGGKQIARISPQGMGDAFKAAAWLLVIDVGLVGLDLVSIAVGETPFTLAADWPVRMVVVVVLCLGVGLFEEGLVRGLLLNGLLARMGGSQRGMMAAVLISSFVFGMMHFDFFIDFTDPLQVGQNCMKVLQTAMVGYLLAGILVKTRNLWTVVLVHAASDFLLMFMTYGFSAEDLTTEYVMAGEEGVAVLLVYVVMCILYIPLVVIATKMLRQAGPWRGDFYHYGEGSTTPQPPGAPQMPAMQQAPAIQAVPMARPAQMTPQPPAQPSQPNANLGDANVTRIHP